MISLALKDTKTFMSHLLVGDTFDSMLLSEATLSMANTYIIKGDINRSFYTADEYNSLIHKEYSCWSDFKPFCFNLIKGNKVPTNMKIIFIMPIEIIARIVNNADTTLTTGDVDGMFINIRYSSQGLSLVTGVAINTFTLDKSIENAFDEYVKQFLNQAQIPYDQE